MMNKKHWPEGIHTSDKWEYKESQKNGKGKWQFCPTTKTKRRK